MHIGYSVNFALDLPRRCSTPGRERNVVCMSTNDWARLNLRTKERLDTEPRRVSAPTPGRRSRSGPVYVFGSLINRGLILLCLRLADKPRPHPVVSSARNLVPRCLQVGCERRFHDNSAQSRGWLADASRLGVKADDDRREIIYLVVFHPARCAQPLTVTVSCFPDAEKERLRRGHRRIVRVRRFANRPSHTPDRCQIRFKR